MGKIKALLKIIINILGVYEQALLLQHKVKRFILGYYGDKNIDIKDINILIDYYDVGVYFDSRSPHEEYQNTIYNQIAENLNPNLVLDIGANYGFTGLLFAKKFKNAQTILVEPSEKLCKYISYNFKQNNQNNYKILTAICGDKCGEGNLFSLNPFSSLDNRVVGKKGWKSITVPEITIDKIINEYYETGNVFIKVDTQGFEKKVIFGGKEFLSNHDNWLMKMEFGPKWLLSQGTDPLDLLNYLISNYSVTEFPNGSRYKREKIEMLFSNEIKLEEAADFISYLVKLDKNDCGWCDLFIKSKMVQE